MNITEREDITWLLERIEECDLRWGKTSKRYIYQGSYDVWTSPDDPENYRKLMIHRLNEVKNLGFIINESGKDDWDASENWKITELGYKHLVKCIKNRNEVRLPANINNLPVAFIHVNGIENFQELIDQGVVETHEEHFKYKSDDNVLADAGKSPVDINKYFIRKKATVWIKPRQFVLSDNIYVTGEVMLFEELCYINGWLNTNKKILTTKSSIVVGCSHIWGRMETSCEACSPPEEFKKYFPAIQ